MSSPATFLGHGSPQPLGPSGNADDDDESNMDIPRRAMQVKVLYTFDDQNKTNCLARLPHALSVPTVQLDDNTQIGVIELKTCIQAIVAHSPELVARLEGHDYTVYAYDFSEYETPLVGQGMLSWVLASSSPTPNAPANQSKTMITGRVCKNIMGLFSKGPKETLEVKLKLVPVPTCLQSEYVESMEKYRALSKIMPPGFDPNAWSAFLKENPEAVSLLNQQTEPPSRPMSQRENSRGIESIHEMLRQNSFSENTPYGMESYASQQSRPASPTPSYRSAVAFPQAMDEMISRPGSRASVRSERPVRPRPRGDSFDAGTVSDGMTEEGPVRKRAKITKADWRGKSAFGTNADSLRVTASTAASIRGFRPGPANSLNVHNSIEPPPRAPTPRPGDGNGAPLRARGRPAKSSLPSLLRHDSTASQPRTYVSPYDPPGSEMAIDTADEDQAGSMGETPSDRDFPSSPPVPYNGSPGPSSPALPPLPAPSDSGFVSDMIMDHEDNAGFSHQRDGHMAPLTSDLPPAAQTPTPLPAPIPQPWPPKPYPRLNEKWTEYMPGPADLLPTRMNIEKPSYKFPRASWADKKAKPARASSSQGSEKEPSASIEASGSAQSNMPTPSSPNSRPTSSSRMEARRGSSSGSTSVPTSLLALPKPSQPPANCSQAQTPNQEPTPSAAALSMPASSASPMNADRSITAGSVTPSGRKQNEGGNQRKLARASSLGGEALVEGVTGPAMDDVTRQQQRSGSGRRRQNISSKLEDSIAAGVPPKWCRNCGEIRTSTWRKCFAAVHKGTPNNIEVTGTEEFGGITGYEIIQSETPDTEPCYRIFKKTLFEFEKSSNLFETLPLCNPCGLWFDKYGTMRPPSKWDKSKEKASGGQGKRQRKRKTKGANQTDLPSDMPLTSEACYDAPPVDPSMSAYQPTANPPAPQAPFASSLMDRQPSEEENKQASSNDPAAAALMRAIQSSPARAFLGTKASPIELEPDLTPKPTRRLLFPSPRKEGEMKSLADSSGSNIAGPDTTPTKTGGRSGKTSQGPSPAESEAADENDKENCPPHAAFDESLDSLFEEGDSTFIEAEFDIALTTPTRKGRRYEELLKTPKSSSKRERNPLTPKNMLGAPVTPSRSVRRTPGFIPPASMTPFTAHLNMLLSDNMMPSSPSGGYGSLQLSSDFEFGQLPSFDSPGKSSLFAGMDGFDMSAFMDGDFLGKAFEETRSINETAAAAVLSSSSPPMSLFQVFEDPTTGASSPGNTESVATVVTTSKSRSDEKMERGSSTAEPQSSAPSQQLNREAVQSGSQVDFTAIIEQVAGKGSPATTTPGTIPTTITTEETQLQATSSNE